MSDELYNSLKKDIQSWQDKDPTHNKIKCYCDRKKCSFPDTLKDEHGNEYLHGVHFINTDLSNHLAMRVVSLDRGIIKWLKFYNDFKGFDEIDIKFPNEITHHQGISCMIEFGDRKVDNVKTVAELYEYLSLTLDNEYDTYFNSLPLLDSIQCTLDKINELNSIKEYIIEI